MNEDIASNILDAQQPVPTPTGVVEVPTVTPTPTIEEADSSAVQVYDMQNPMPVVIVDAQEEEIEPFVFGGTYPGTISETYLDYFRGIAVKLLPTEDYVVWRSGQYGYSMAWGDLEYDSGEITGDNVSICNIYRSNDNYNTNYYTDFFTDSVSVPTVSLFVYSNLENFPDIRQGGGLFETYAIIFALSVLLWILLGSRLVDIVHKCYKRSRK